MAISLKRPCGVRGMDAPGTHCSYLGLEAPQKAGVTIWLHELQR